MNEQHLQIMRDEIGKAVGKAIETHVNGGIRNLTKTLNEHIEADARYQEEDARFKEDIRRDTKETKEHIEETKPYLQAGKGIQILWKFFIVLGGGAAAYLAFKTAITPK